MSLQYPVPASELINYTDENGLSCWIEPDPWPWIMNERRLEAERKAKELAFIEQEKERKGLTNECRNAEDVVVVP